jgi:penicillin-binding protein 1A
MTGRAPKPKAGPRGNARKGKHGPRWKRWLGRGLLVALVLAALGAAAVTVVFLEYAPRLADGERSPPVRAAPDDPASSTGTARCSARSSVSARTVVPLDRIPRVMILATLAAEDADFFQHRGLDYPGILRAIMRDIVERRRAQGASTITQQVVKTAPSFAGANFPPQGAGDDLGAPHRADAHQGRDPFPLPEPHQLRPWTLRVEEASGFYFGKHAAELTLAEATLLAGIPQSPSQLSPRKNAASARARQMRVIDQLERKRETHWPELSAKDIAAAREAQIKLRELPAETESAPEVVAMARRELLDRVGEGRFARGGFVVHTTIDLGLQREARAALQRRLEELDGRHGFRVPPQGEGQGQAEPGEGADNAARGRQLRRRGRGRIRRVAAGHGANRRVPRCLRRRRVQAL